MIRRQRSSERRRLHHHLAASILPPAPVVSQVPLKAWPFCESATRNVPRRTLSLLIHSLCQTQPAIVPSPTARHGGKQPRDRATLDLVKSGRLLGASLTPEKN